MSNMNRCENHDHLVGTHQEAHIAARCILNVAGPELSAEFITSLGTNICCGAVGYAQYLMANAMREELLPNGWFEPVAQNMECVKGQRTLLDERCSVHGYRHYPGNVNASVITDGCYVVPDWPSEQQVMDWNIHNDHADGMERDAR